ncbi:hypothetical protein FJZ21_00160 [Candidatus Pacearchaeota archaeon]|nr:hypothetical protein [Candidatus Pacearchaeota archaeon]
MENTQQLNTTSKFEAWYEKRYKLLFFIPVILLVISLVYLGVFYSKNGEFIYKDSTLAGGTTLTLNNVDVPIEDLRAFLEKEFSDLSIREIRDLTSGRLVALIIDTTSQPEELKSAVEEFLGFELTANNSSIEFTGSSLSANFYKQLIIAIIISFVLISIVVFFLFRQLIRSAAIVVAVLGNIIMPLALVDALGIKLSAAGIAAFLMLMGYSVDTDILLTSRVLKRREGTVNQRIFGAFKTGIFITGTALIALLPAFFLVTGLPDSFRQIFLILSFGLCADIINTWLFNAAVLKWYEERKK